MTAAGTLPETLAAGYLKGLCDLAAEMEAAMGAIARNALPDLEDSVGRQEALCTRLASMARRLGPEAAGDRGSGLAHPAANSASGTGHRIRAANLALRDLSRRYSALLKHSGRSIELLSSLCGSYAGQAYQAPSKEARRAGSKHQTWYCEM